MQRLSSNSTLFFKLFIPTAWISFFGLLGVVMFLVDSTDQPLLGSTSFRIGFLIFLLLFIVIIYFTLFQLKRVETEDGFVFVTDYFKTVKFPIDTIDRISVTNLGLVRIARLHLQHKGHFGSKIPFITNWVNFQPFYEQYLYSAEQK